MPDSIEVKILLFGLVFACSFWHLLYIGITWLFRFSQESSWQSLKNPYIIFRILATVIGILGIYGALVSLVVDEKNASSLTGLLLSLYPELIGISVTIWLIDRISDLIKEDREKNELIRQLGSQLNIIARNAVDALRTGTSPLTNGDLQGASLVKANLEGAYLYDAYLSKTNLYGAILNDSVCNNIKLIETNLSHAKLIGADYNGP